MCRLRLVLVPLTVLPACQPDAFVAPLTERPAFAISDGAHSNGNTHFFFLPPVVPEPSFAGTFDGWLAPVVDICEWTGTACTLPLTAEFTTATGPGSETVRVVPEDEHYVVNWHTRDFNLDEDKNYRIRVLVAGTELGYVDIDVVKSARGLKGVNADNFFAIVNGRSVPIKFRIEQGAVFVVSPGGGTVQAMGESVVLEFPEGAVAEDVGVTAEPVSSFPEDPWFVGVTAFDIGPEGAQFFEPVQLTLKYDPTQIPPGVEEASLALHKVVGVSWQRVVGSTVNVTEKTVTGLINSLSVYAPLATLTILAPVQGPFRVTREENPECFNDRDPMKWTFCQHQTDLHRPGGGIEDADETMAWDMNLLNDADNGKPVFAVAPGKVVKYAGVHDPGEVSGGILIEHVTNDIRWWSGYLHMTDIQVIEGQEVDASAILGRISNIIDSDFSIPNHLHFVVYIGDNKPSSLRSRDAEFVERPLPAVFWRRTNFPDLPQPRGIVAMDVDPSDRIYVAVSSGNVGSSGPGVWRSLDPEGDAWEQVIDGLTDTNAKSLTITPGGQVFVGTHTAGVFRLAADGVSWVQTGFRSGPIHFMASTADAVYALDGFFCRGIFRSTDGGASWTAINNGLATCVNGIAVNSAGHLFAATGTSGVFRSTNNGASWTAVNSGITVLTGRTVAINSADHIFVGTDRRFVGDPGHIFRSTNNGESWTDVTGTVATEGVYFLAFTPGDDLFAGTILGTGIFRSMDNGASWEAVNSGSVTDAGTVTGIAFQTTGHAVAAGGPGVWRSTRPGTNP